ncbi:tRNA pseudouridine(55) synthase TruB [Psychrobacter sp. I-STPA6b]|uniref:tRNA pseudouridine(55) synthase TruB n=1 Tax=Psychrobacter sp. I-STPA6b TaxID=2585718 RepID=UPI001D0C0CE5|nr:tRNA pseudouridine(55) synthase TruB [Psychrobacter sp. I-STPA6b]
MNVPIQKHRVCGVILIDKPQGMTSQQVVSKVKYLFKSPQHDSKKAGHTGTLDPMATGLLPICLGEATKFSHYQLDANKSYEAILQLGQQTDTGDAEGQVIYHCAVPVLTSEALQQVAQQFLGASEQVPPMYSALKKDGKKLYEYAREGIEIERPSRAIFLHQLALTQLSPDSIKITVTCSKGTYVRVLGEDIAKALGSVGHLIGLRRIAVGDFDIANAMTLTELEELSLTQRLTSLLPVDACIENVPSITLPTEACERLYLGQRLNVLEHMDEEVKSYLMQKASQSTQHISQQTEQQKQKIHSDAYDIRILNHKGIFVGLGALSSNGRLQPKKMVQY